jgi:hypothetical protein
VTVTDYQFQILEGVKVAHLAASTLKPKFGSELGVGTIILKDVAGALDLGGAALANQTLAAGTILLGSGANLATAVSLHGDVTTDNVGAVLISNDVVISSKLSPGLRTELADHEGRIVSLEVSVALLQSAVNAIQNNLPAQCILTSTAGQTVFTATGGMTWVFDDAVFDIEVDIDGRVQYQTDAFTKTSATVITFAEALPIGKKVRIFKRGTASGPAIVAGPGSTDLTAIAVSPRPNLNGGVDLGSPTKAFASLYIKDTASAQTYQFTITNGVATWEPI